MSKAKEMFGARRANISVRCDSRSLNSQHHVMRDDNVDDVGDVVEMMSLTLDMIHHHDSERLR